MSIFRRRGSSAAPEPEPADETGSLAGVSGARSTEPSGDPAIAAPGGITPAEGSGRRVEANRSAGPFDRSEVPDSSGRLDLGSLWVSGRPGMELRLEVDETAQQIVAANALVGDSALHLQAFAAPRSTGVWDEIRGEIAASITQQGGTADEVAGPLGTELRAQMPAAGPGGRTVYSPARFVGVDGPRWFLRAVLSGRAAQDAAAAEPLLDIVRDTVVVRGEEAMAPRDLLPLQLPRNDADAGAEGDGGVADGSGGGNPSGAGSTPGADEPDEIRGAGSFDDLRPFDRGPEITEIH